MLEPVPPKGNNRCGRWRDHRQLISGIIHRLGTGRQWRKLPEHFGPWQTVHERHQLWSANGTWERLLQHVQAVADAEGDVDDSTSIRAHQHTADAPQAPPPTPSTASKRVVQSSVHLRAHMRA
ncbi:transposase [Streptomyces sp. ML-6]|uniref:transposase n=1 Tax=Streptomyces sp. ML-6 TaxID=2982693 RepID=UPI0024C04AFC|nr:transposase [Streptomyces sp. ML-6]MDK0524342.1 transposase [Streptomyces sp. ML-6]